MLASAILTCLTLLIIAWFVHFIVWRVHIPTAYPYWIISIFSLTFVLYAVSYINLHTAPLSAQIFWLFSCLVPYAMISIAYLMIYAGIIEYSPSVEILLEIKKHMPSGIPINNLRISTLPEYKLTGIRIDHLLNGKMINRIDNTYTITPRGKRYAKFIAWYRKMLFINFPGEG